ncbi:MAG: P-loop NTPase [Ilumatobacter sp.]
MATSIPPASDRSDSTDAPSTDEVFAALRTVIDPELHVDIVSLGMVPGVTIDEGIVTVSVKLTIGGCPLRAEIKREIQDRVGIHPGVDEVRIDWGEMTPEERSEVMGRARRAAQESAPETAVPSSCRVIAVASGKGGVGKSSVTVNLAAGLAARGFTVGVLDADIWGFSVPRLLGMSDRMEASEVDGRPRIIPNRRTVGEGTLEVVSTGFLVEESTALMWRGLMLTKAVEQFLNDVAWGDLDYLLIDMPPGTGDVQMGLARMLPRTEMLIVTTPARAAQKVAQRAADMARRSFLPVIGVVENGRGCRALRRHRRSAAGLDTARTATRRGGRQRRAGRHRRRRPLGRGAAGTGGTHRRGGGAGARRRHRHVGVLRPAPRRGRRGPRRGVSRQRLPMTNSGSGTLS